MGLEVQFKPTEDVAPEQRARMFRGDIARWAGQGLDVHRLDDRAREKAVRDRLANGDEFRWVSDVEVRGRPGPPVAGPGDDRGPSPPPGPGRPPRPRGFWGWFGPPPAPPDGPPGGELRKGGRRGPPGGPVLSRPRPTASSCWCAGRFGKPENAVGHRPVRNGSHRIDDRPRRVVTSVL